MTHILSRAPVPYKGTEIHRLTNGLTVILKEDHTVPVVSMQIWVNCGAVNETPKIAGISHGLEHMVFKGTPLRSAGEIIRAIESSGGVINAATQMENTYYYIDIPSYGTSVALDVLTDTLSHPAFPPEELERERLVILEEIKRRDDHPNSTLWDEFTAQIFRGNPYGKRIIGDKKTVSNLSRADLVRYFTAHYVPANMCIVMVGDFRKRKIMPQIKNTLGTLKAKRPPSGPPFKSRRVKPSAVKIKRPVQLNHLAMGIPTFGLLHKDVVKLDVLSDILGGGISCRLFQKLREEMKIVLSVTSDFMAYRNKGIFAVFAESFPDKSEQVKAMVKQEIKNLQTLPITPAELKRAQTRIKSSWLHEAETFQDRASTLGSFFTSRRMDLLSCYISEVENTTLGDLNRVLKKYVLDNEFFITEVVPL